jgi:hypothetical protein
VIQWYESLDKHPVEEKKKKDTFSVKVTDISELCSEVAKKEG